ncbi:SusC/RagA family TonB-linked outer membrane protein [Aridibaculum aurantiacum]|uniref:SusC/RagA family TonB-linked outer membrane protein n=1 Tax=Aridibaculum aurantiacum TaxID=2810307 RepID=UPI001A9688CB|nr:TonB-dependent receptor [Aridibaculum aurantiacum]
MKCMATRSLLKLMIATCCILLSSLSFKATAQNVTVTGRVTNDSGQVIPGASVSVVGSTQGTSTNEAGVFSLSVPPNSSLIASAIGYAAKTVRATPGTPMTISLVYAQRQLEQVVVVGYGTQRKRDVTGAVVSVNETALREVPVANIQGALQGRAAGLEVQSVGTNPGAGAQIRIRGIRSISGSNDPLIVLDGIPYDGSLNDINPGDITAVDILKDASATAIYGSRGANGVILITTKRGRTGETRVSYNGFYGLGTVANKYPVFNAQEYQAMRNISTFAQGYQPEELESIRKGISTDWQDVMYQKSHKTDHNLNISGGSNGNTFSLGGGYYKETSVLPGQDFTRYSLRGTIDTRIGRNLKVGLNTINTLGITNGSQFVNPMFPLLSLSPLMPVYDSLGKPILSPTGNNDDRLTQYNPIFLKNNNNSWSDRVRRLRSFNSLYGEYQITTGLKYRLNVGLSYAQQQQAQFRASDDPLGITPSYFRPRQGNIAFVGNGEEWGYTIENLLTYDKTIKKHRFNVVGLYSVQESQNYNTTITKENITENFIQWYALGLSDPAPAAVLGGGEARSSLLSYMARINYAFDDRFLLTLTGRADGSSRLAPGNKWHYYPAISAGWNIDRESFMDRADYISNLKLRVGYGQTSNQAISPYNALGLVSNQNGVGNTAGIIRYNFGPTVVTGYNVVTLPNPNLSWEFTKTLNVGLDFGLLKNRITGSLEFYDSKTDRILYGVNLPVTSGVAGAYTTNVGEMQNRGMEFTLTTDNIRSAKGFNWSSDLNLFFNRNKLLKLTDNIERNVGSQLHVGYSMTSIYDFKKLGIWQMSEAAEAAKYGAVPGQLKLADVNGVDATGKQTGQPDGKIDDNDRHIIGNSDAKIQGGFTNRFSYKNWDLSVVTYGRFGGMLISQIHQPLASYLTIMNGVRSGIKVDYWTPTNPSNWFPMPQAAISPQSTAWTTLGYYNASFLKIRSINLGYTFSNNQLRRMNAQSIRLYATVDNVAILFSPYRRLTGIDPEGTNTGNAGVVTPGNIRGGNNGVITINAATPQRRTFIIGANINF